MSRSMALALFFGAVFLQSGTYGLTFLLPELFAAFGGDERDVGAMLALTALVTVLSVYGSGHISDRVGRVRTLGLSGFAIAASLFLYARATGPGPGLFAASALIGFGWGLMYTLSPIVLTRLSDAGGRVRLFSLFSVFMMAGFGLSPVFAAWLQGAGFSIRDAFAAVGVACIVSGCLFLMLHGPLARHAVGAGPEGATRLSPAIIGAILHSRARVPVVMVLLGASVFAGVNNFQTSIAQAEGLDYADYFLAYTLTTIACRIAFAGFSGGAAPYRVIAMLQVAMCAGVLLFLIVDGSRILYILCAVLFGIGYGASYPILAAMAANDARDDLVPQTLQLFALVYFVGIFGFPYIAGWLIVEAGIPVLLCCVAVLAATEAGMAWRRGGRR